MNQPGSYECECQAGYSGNGKTCDQVDECAAPELNDCDGIASCTDSDGSCLCQCPLGAVGDGVSCIDTRRAQWRLPKGDVAYQLTDVGGDKIVTDKVTMLDWQRNGKAGLTWDQAVKFCNDLDYAGQTDWRLPTRIELVTLATFTGLKLDDLSFVAAGQAWSISEYAADSSQAWLVDFDGSYLGMYDKASKYDARCVRAGASTNVGPRYEEDGMTALDVATGLRWHMDGRGAPARYYDAGNDCDAAVYGSYQDWRLPSLRELLTLIDDTRSDVAVDPRFDVNPQSYWVTTKSASGNQGTVDLTTGTHTATNPNNLRSWLCVHDP